MGGSLCYRIEWGGSNQMPKDVPTALPHISHLASGSIYNLLGWLPQARRVSTAVAGKSQAGQRF
jgi:hypothetical protein